MDRPLTHTSRKGCAEQEGDKIWLLFLIFCFISAQQNGLCSLVCSSQKGLLGKATKLKAVQSWEPLVIFMPLDIYTGGASVCAEAAATSNFFVWVARSWWFCLFVNEYGKYDLVSGEIMLCWWTRCFIAPSTLPIWGILNRSSFASPQITRDFQRTGFLQPKDPWFPKGQGKSLMTQYESM